MNSKLVYIVLVNWNKTYLTIDCINSINKSDYNNFKLVVVDNGTSDGSLGLLKDSNLNFDLICLNSNTGYTGGNNVGIKFALSQKCDYVFLLNNDTFINSDTISILISKLSSTNEIAIAQPKILAYPDKSLIWCGPTSINKLLMKPKLVGFGKENIKGYLDQEKFIDYAVGCAAMIKTSLINEIGLLDDDYFAGCEDVDYGFRTRMVNKKILYIPSAIVYHLESVSAGGSDNPKYIYILVKAFLLLFSKWNKNIFHFILINLYFLLYNFKRSFIHLLKGNYKVPLAILIGYIDFIFKKYGNRDYYYLNKK